MLCIVVCYIEQIEVLFYSFLPNRINAKFKTVAIDTLIGDGRQDNGFVFFPTPKPRRGTHLYDRQPSANGRNIYVWTVVPPEIHG